MYMKKRYVVVLMLVVVLSAQVTHAQDVASTTEVGTTTPSVITEPVEKEAVPRNALTPEKQKRVTNLIANISNVLDIRIVRLRDITTRIERRAAKMEQEGFDVTEARKKAEVAKSLLATAERAMATIDTRVYQTVTSEKPQELWLVLKGDLQSTYKTLHDAQVTLKETINLLRESSIPSKEETASTTTTTLAE
jgi:mannose-6-phosphate isomerase-like protein (cupin superfamily)